MERMDCMEYMDQVVGNISKGFQKRNLKTDVTFKKIDVALVFLLFWALQIWKFEDCVGNGGIGGSKSMENEYCFVEKGKKIDIIAVMW